MHDCKILRECGDLRGAWEAGHVGSQLTPSDSPLRRKDVLDGRPPLRELLADLQRSFTTVMGSSASGKRLWAFKTKENKKPLRRDRERHDHGAGEASDQGTLSISILYIEPKPAELESSLAQIECSRCHTNPEDVVGTDGSGLRSHLCRAQSHLPQDFLIVNHGYGHT